MIDAGERFRATTGLVAAPYVRHPLDRFFDLIDRAVQLVGDLMVRHPLPMQLPDPMIKPFPYIRLVPPLDHCILHGRACCARTTSASVLGWSWKEPRSPVTRAPVEEDAPRHQI